MDYNSNVIIVYKNMAPDELSSNFLSALKKKWQQS